MYRITTRFVHVSLGVFMVWAAAAPAAFADANTDLLRFIVAEQRAGAAKALDNLSYTMTMQGYDTDDGNRIPIDTRIHAVKSGTSLDATKEHNVVCEFDNGNPSMIRPMAERIVLNDEMLLDWQDQSQPILFVLFARDWQSQSKEYSLARRAADALVVDPMAVAYSCTNGEIPLARRIQDYLDSPETSPMRWTVETVMDAGGKPATFVLHRSILFEGRFVPDLTVYVDATRNCIVTKSFYESPDPAAPWTRSYTKDYQRAGDAWILKRMEHIDTENGTAEPNEKDTTIFQDVSTEPPTSPDRFTMAAMNLPSQMGVAVGVPGQKHSALLNYGQLELVDGQFVAPEESDETS